MQLPQLTQRQLEIVNLLIRGYTRAEAAKKLHLSYPTVNNHMQNIYYKFQVNSFEELKEKLV